MSTSTDAPRIEAVREALRNVLDPELALNVVDLGMITDIAIDDDTTTVSMVLTTVSCPFWELFTGQVQDALREVPGIGQVRVLCDTSQQWTPDRMADEARWELEIAGLLPTMTWLTAARGRAA